MNRGEAVGCFRVCVCPAERLVVEDGGHAASTTKEHNLLQFHDDTFSSQQHRCNPPPEFFQYAQRPRQDSGSTKSINRDALSIWYRSSNAISSRRIFYLSFSHQPALFGPCSDANNYYRGQRIFTLYICCHDSLGHQSSWIGVGRPEPFGTERGRREGGGNRAAAYLDPLRGSGSQALAITSDEEARRLATGVPTRLDGDRTAGEGVGGVYRGPCQRLARVQDDGGGRLDGGGRRRRPGSAKATCTGWQES